ncbi:fimbrial biogenesis chaperone [Sphingobium sp. CR28]|uniref:fimbrial biogenesis chaperone n=1 Tax=Sphingobium sp. CR28 TaxID=3400272 RepID=UPI003FEFE140
MPWRTRLCLGTLLLLFAALAPASAAHASGAVLVWPVDPVIEHDQQAVALWLENRGSKASLLQVRILAWTQVDGEDRYADQEEIVGTPPMIRIEPGKRQMVRLTRAVPMSPGVERAFRVLIDEIPANASPAAADEDAPSVGVRLQFRYSIPLFVYGEGLWWKPRGDRQRNPASAGQPALSWRIVRRDGKPYLEIGNTGPVHARLTGVRFTHGGEAMTLAEGLLGYVLAGSSLRRPLPEAVAADATLMATVNGGPEALAIVPAN